MVGGVLNFVSNQNKFCVIGLNLQTATGYDIEYILVRTELLAIDSVPLFVSVKQKREIQVNY